MTAMYYKYIVVFLLLIINSQSDAWESCGIEHKPYLSRQGRGTINV